MLFNQTVAMITPRTLRLITAIFALCLGMNHRSVASSVIPLSHPEHIAAAGVVFHGVVVGVDSYRDPADGQIYTRSSLRVIETFKGTTPTIVAIVHPGGEVGGVAKYCGFSPVLKRGEQRVVFATRRSDGKLTGVQGAASVIKLTPENGTLPPEQQAWLDEIRALTNNGQMAGDDASDQTGFVTSDLTTGLIGYAGGFPTRFVQQDSGDPIPYVIDADNLPTGITLSQATNAVAQALNAWSAVTSLKFRFDGIQSFGMSAYFLDATDGRLYIQLHDNYNFINSPNTLGVASAVATSDLAGSAGWGAGGNVAGNEFHQSVSGYVILERTNAAMQNLATLAEVLCHEIGHAIGMAHSSENLNEPNNTLKQSVMYYLVHADGRGAALGSYDPPVIRQAYPVNNTPPHMPVPFPFHRVIDATTASSALNINGINEVEIRGFDLQSTALTLWTNDQATTTGSFSLQGNKIRFLPPIGNFSDTARDDPFVEFAGPFSFYNFIYARLSDGTNASPYTGVRVISLCRDSAAPLDGIPNYWMNTFFGHTAPQAADLSRATDDADGDKLNTLQEYITGMLPKNSGSAQRITSFTGNTLQFQARAFELYEILGSTNLINWTHVGFTFPTNASLAVRTSLPQTNITATVSGLSVANPHRFYRVLKVP